MELARELPSKRVLVGISYLSPDGRVVEQKQFFGRVEVADPSIGIVLALEGKRLGEKYVLPPDTRPFVVAPPGEYALRSTGEVVVDPDYTVTYSSQSSRSGRG